jgi:hypothetical protein
MKWFYYTLAFVVFEIMGIIFSVLMVKVTMPFLKYIIQLQEKIHKKSPNMYGLRYDFILQRIAGGIILGFTFRCFLNLIPQSISFLFVGLIYCWSTLRWILSWDRTNPWEYEASIVFSALIGECVGYYVFILPYFK